MVSIAFLVLIPLAALIYICLVLKKLYTQRNYQYRKKPLTNTVLHATNILCVVRSVPSCNFSERNGTERLGLAQRLPVPRETTGSLRGM